MDPIASTLLYILTTQILPFHTSTLSYVAMFLRFAKLIPACQSSLVSSFPLFHPSLPYLTLINSLLSHVTSLSTLLTPSYLSICYMVHPFINSDFFFSFLHPTLIHSLLRHCSSLPQASSLPRLWFSTSITCPSYVIRARAIFLSNHRSLPLHPIYLEQFIPESLHVPTTTLFFPFTESSLPLTFYLWVTF